MSNVSRYIILVGLVLTFSFLGGGCATLPPAHEPIPEQVASPAPTPVPTPTPQTLTVLVGGDVLPGCFLDPYLEKYGLDYPYENLAPYFQAVDMGLVNLETPLSDQGQRVRKKEFTFRCLPDSAQALKRAGINAVALANNHILDYGAQALQDTLAALDKSGIAYAGAGKNYAAARKAAALTFPNGQTVALLSYSLTYPSRFWATKSHPGTALARFSEMEADINSANAWADWVVVCFHWGQELKNYPRDYQIQYGHAAIDYGADVVVGTHPHVLQGVEWYKDRLILYSLGNLVFGGGNSRRSIESVLVKIQLSTNPQRLLAWALPIDVHNAHTAFKPNPLLDQAGKMILYHLEQFSQAWGTSIQSDASGWGALLPPALAAPVDVNLAGSERHSPADAQGNSTTPAP